jgi:hypothetical protein
MLFILILAFCALFPLGHTIAWVIACIVSGVFFDPGPLAGVPALLISALLIVALLIYIVEFSTRFFKKTSLSTMTKLKASDLYRAARDKYCHPVVLISKKA